MESAATAKRTRNRRNLVLAWALVAFAMAVMVSVFWWRFAHHQPTLPAGGATGTGYNQGYTTAQPQGAPVNNFAY